MIRTLEHVNPTQRLDTVREDIVEELCAAITRSGLTFLQLAERSGITSATISRWVHRETMAPRTSTMLAVGRVLGLRLTWVADAGKH